MQNACKLIKRKGEKSHSRYVGKNLEAFDSKMTPKKKKNLNIEESIGDKRKRIKF